MQHSEITSVYSLIHFVKTIVSLLITRQVQSRPGLVQTGESDYMLLQIKDFHPWPVSNYW